MKEQMLDSEYYVCPECGKIFRFYPSTIYVKNTGEEADILLFIQLLAEKRRRK